MATLHPQVVHFVIALGLLGVLFRVFSLLGRGAWLNPAAAALLILAAGAGVVAQKSGHDAHGPVERVPGSAEAVQVHETWGDRTRTILLVVGALEILGLLLATRSAGKMIRGVSALVGLGAAVCIFEAGDHGGDLVYNYAGGVGLRSGSPEDVKRLLLAGTYHEARLARDSGRAEEAARLTDQLLLLQPDDPAVRFLGVESKLKDRHDPEGALADLSKMQIAPDDPRLATRYGILMAQALAAQGHTDSARAVLTALAAKFPESSRVKAELKNLK